MSSTAAKRAKRIQASAPGEDEPMAPAKALRRPKVPALSFGRRPTPLATGLLAVGVFAYWASAEAGYAPDTWYPGALILLAALLAAAAGRDSLMRGQPRALRWSVALFGAFTAWCFLSIAWADVRGDAWDGANRTLVYFTVYLLFAGQRWRTSEAAFLLGAFSLAVAALGALAFVETTVDGAATGLFDGRFVEPAGYANANCALCLIAFWPALFLASRRETAPLVRGLMLAAAGVLLQLAILAQSRAAVFAAPLALVLYLLIVPGRIRTAILALLPLTIVTLASLTRLLDVYGERDGGVEAALDRERTALLLSAAVLLLVGTAAGMIDRRWAPAWSRGQPGLEFALAGAAALLAGVVALLLVAGDPLAPVQDGWRELTGGGRADASALGSSRFTGDLSSGRYDLWRVAMGEFADRPLEGTGVDNFAVDYVRERRNGEEPLYPHSLVLRLLSQTGVVGLLLCTGFVVAALAAVRRRRELGEAYGRALAVAAVVPFGYWLLHGSVDWFWEFPALTAPALACLGLGAALAAGPPGASPSTRRGGARRVALVGGLAAFTILAAASYALPWLAARDLEQAARSWSTDRTVAYSRLERARKLNFLSDKPDVLAGAIARQLGEPDRARAAFLRALQRNPSNWYAHVELASLDLAAGSFARARRRLERASTLNPLEPTIRAALLSVARRQQLTATLLEDISRQALPTPLGRRSVYCLPFFALRVTCDSAENR